MNDLTPEEQAAIQEGLQAESLLAMPFFAKLIEDLNYSCAAEILETKPEDHLERERIYYRAQGIQEIQRAIQKKVNAKASIIFQLEQAEEALEE